MTNVLAMTVEDIRDSYEDEIEEQDEAYVNAVIDRAVRKLLALPSMSTVMTRVDAGVLNVELVKDTVITAVLRVIRNPEGLEGEHEGNYEYKLRNLVASGDIWFSDADLLPLLPVKPSNAPKTVFSKLTKGWGFP